MACSFCGEDGHNKSQCPLPSKPCKVDISRTKRTRPAIEKQIKRTITKTSRHCIAYSIGVTGNPHNTARDSFIQENYRELRTIWRSKSRKSISETFAEEIDRRESDRKFDGSGPSNLDKSREGLLYLFIAYR